MEIRFATKNDIPYLLRLLRQVNLIHHIGRPDIFNIGTKYTERELISLLEDEKKPILVCCEGEEVRGYAFCVLQDHAGDNILTDIKTLYLDDLCVDEGCRGKHIGRSLYEAVLALARENGCYNVTLNVWAENPGALEFYRAMGMSVMKTTMEQIL